MAAELDVLSLGSVHDFSDEPLTPEQILAEVFRVSKNGLGGITPETLVSHVATSRDIITSTDEKGWTPVLWASFHGHWKVISGRKMACFRKQTANAGAGFAIGGSGTSRCRRWLLLTPFRVWCPPGGGDSSGQRGVCTVPGVDD